MLQTHVLNFIVDRFQTNNTLIYFHALLYNVAWYKHLFWFKVQVLSIAFVSCSVLLHAQLFVKYQQSNYTATDANYLKCHALLAALHFLLETTGITMHLSALWASTNKNWTFVCLVLVTSLKNTIKIEKENWA